MALSRLDVLSLAESISYLQVFLMELPVMGDTLMSTCDYEQPFLPVCTDSIAETVQSRLQMSPYRSLQRLRCDYYEGVLALRGEVPTFFLKQVAQTIARKVQG